MIIKKTKYTEANRGYNLKNHLDILKQLKKDFKFESSTYTAKIETDTTIINFIYKSLSKSAFISANKIKKDIQNSTVIKPKVNTNDLEYFQQDLKAEVLKYVINFDFTKAYLNILYTDNFITKETFIFCCNLKKNDRLAAVGMLARRKNIFHFQNGKPVYTEIKKSENSEYFFYCVQKTNFIISQLRNSVNARFLFSWVDGIYFELKNETELINIQKEVFNICEIYNMKFTTEILTDYVSTFENNIFQIYFNKDGKEKRFTIPSHELSLNYNTYKKINGNV
jgi:hypothetical protein